MLSFSDGDVDVYIQTNKKRRERERKKRRVKYPVVRYDTLSVMWNYLMMMVLIDGDE